MRLGLLLWSVLAVCESVVRLGNPREFPSFLLYTRNDAVKPQQAAIKGQERNTLHKALQAAALQNGCELDEETATDGNCGLDALLRCLSSLEQSQIDRFLLLLQLATAFSITYFKATSITYFKATSITYFKATTKGLSERRFDYLLQGDLVFGTPQNLNLLCVPISYFNLLSNYYGYD